MSTYLITGANRGLGLAMSRVALEQGARVHATARRPREADDLLHLQDRFGDQLEIHRLSLDEPADREGIRDALTSRDEWIDVLVNNAGIYIRSPEVAPAESHRSVESARADTMLRMFGINAVAPFLLTRSLLPRIRRNAGAKIAFLSSGMASLGRKGRGEVEYSYSASKAALNMLSRVLATELERDDIRVVALNPGWVATDMGTAAAPLDPVAVAKGLIRVIGSLEASASGSFLDYEGHSVPW